MNRWHRLIWAGLLLGTIYIQAADPRIIFEDSFDDWATGPVKAGGEGAVNAHWFLFSSVKEGSSFQGSAAVEEDPQGGRALVLRAAVSPIREARFFIGLRRVITADLAGVDLEHIKLTARTRMSVQGEHRRYVMLPQEFRYNLQIESLHKRRSRGVRQFELLGGEDWSEAGGRLSEAISGRRREARDISIHDEAGRYQVVLVLTSCCGSLPTTRKDYQLELWLDDLKLEVIDDEDELVDAQVQPDRFASDLCMAR